MQKNKIRYVKFSSKPVFILFVIVFNFCKISYSEELSVGKKYKTLKPIFISAWFDDLGKKVISRETARAYLNEVKTADRPYIAFQHEVPAGTIITIIGRAPKAWYLYFNSDHYFVTLEPDVSQGLEVKLPLDSPLESGLGDKSGLSAEFFSPI